MKERPILFSAPMVRAILDDRKTQTRRSMRPQPPAGWFAESPDDVRESGEVGTPRWLVERCPHGKPGNRLWVKETIHRVHPDGRGCAIYAADGAATPIDTWPWKRDVLAAIHTPRGASRITLEITEVRVQRLQEISEDDARAEGVERDTEPCDHTRIPCDEIGCLGSTFRSTFCELWGSINGKRAPWSSDPWLWAITFRRVPR